MSIDFQNLRDQWALKWPYSESSVAMQRQADRNANPHNDGPPKRPIREDSQIISDLSYRFADEVLKQQYGIVYIHWWDDEFIIEWGFPKRRRF